MKGVEYVSLYPVTIQLLCGRCKYTKTMTVSSFKAQKQWTTHYEDEHWMDCDGELVTLVPT